MPPRIKQRTKSFNYRRHYMAKLDVYNSSVDSSPPVDPPPEGGLPFEDGPVSNPEKSPYRVLFYNSGSLDYSGMEGVLLNDYVTVLTSAAVATVIAADPLDYYAVAGVSDLADNTYEQDAGIYGATPHPLYSPINYSNDLGYVTTSGFFNSNAVASIEYSPAYDTTPYSGEYFYPEDTTVEWCSNYNAKDVAVLTISESTTGSVISDTALSIYGYGTDATSIGVVYTGSHQGAIGSCLIAGGYGSYFAVGPLSLMEWSSHLAIFSRISHGVTWLYGDTGILPIVYP